MKRIIIVLAAVTLAFAANAQQSGHSNYIGLNLGGGLNTMTFSPNQGSNSLGLGFDAGLHYTHFFGEHFGLGFGVHYTYANAYAEYNFNEQTPNCTNSGNPGVNYTLYTNFNNWKERETIGVLGIPVEVFYRSVMSDKWSFIGGLGVQFDLPLHGSYNGADGNFSTSGVFPSLGNYHVTDVPEHGFSTYDNVEDGKIDNLGLAISVIADLGFRMALNDNWGLYFGIYGGYGISNMISEKSSASLLVVDVDDPSKIDYHGTFGSNQVDALHMLRAGVKIGIDLGWNCEDDAERMAAAERRAAEKQAEADRKAAEKAAAEKAKAEKAAADKAAAEKAAAEKAAAEKAKSDAEKAKADADKAAADKAATENGKTENTQNDNEPTSAANKAAAERARAEKAAAEKAAAEKAAAEKAKADTKDRLKKLGAVTVYFNTASDEPIIDATTDAAIRTICEAVKSLKDININIIGHTDNTGSSEYNMELGQRRADALRYYMMNMGVPAYRIKCESRGENEPAATNDNDEGRAKNRRASATVEVR